MVSRLQIRCVLLVKCLKGYQEGVISIGPDIRDIRKWSAVPTIAIPLKVDGIERGLNEWVQRHFNSVERDH